MRKRVLLAEESDTVRNVAESTLRQNGFEVISVGSGQRALEVLELSKPDLIIVASDMLGKGRKPVYEHCQEDGRISSVPLILLAEPGATDLPYPQEAIINKPFEPKELIDKVSVFAGKPVAAPQSSDDGNPLGDAQLEDDLLDAALGLDHIDVTDSEVMDKTQVPGDQKKSPRSPEKMVGYDYDSDDDLTDSRRVESLIIREEDSDIRHSSGQKESSDSMSSSGKLEILNDQYGLIEKQSPGMEREGLAHDYNWFVNEMQRDSESLISSKPAPASAGPGTDSGGIHISDTSSMVDPVTPPPKEADQAKPASQSRPGVDKFIDEFRQEMKKLRLDEPESVTIADSDKVKGKSEGTMSWQDSLEKMTPEQIGVFTQGFVRELANRVAELIAAKIDEEKLLNLLKKEIVRQLEKKR